MFYTRKHIAAMCRKKKIYIKSSINKSKFQNSKRSIYWAQVPKFAYLRGHSAMTPLGLNISFLPLSHVAPPHGSVVN